MIGTESVLSFAEAAREMPRVAGKKVHVSTIWRWARKGIQGEKLETRRIGGTFVTSLEAIDRFCQRLAAIELPERPTAVKPNKPSNDRQRDSSLKSADRVLTTAGILR